MTAGTAAAAAEPVALDPGAGRLAGAASGEPRDRPREPLAGRALRCLAALAGVVLLLCLPSTSAASAGEPQGQQRPVLLGPGAGYADPAGSAPVRELQRELQTRGQEPGAIDGLYGPRTRAAVARFQRARGLAVDGIAGPQTGAALQSRGESASLLRSGAGYTSPQGWGSVRELQRSLRSQGLKPGPIDGRYGPQTRSAVERFQQGHGLAVDGVAGPRTERRLGRLADEPTRQRPRAGAPVRPEAVPAPADDLPRPAPPEPPGARTPALVGLSVLLAVALLLALFARGPGRRRALEARLNLGLVCAAVLASFGIGAAGGALFAASSAPADRATAKPERALIPKALDAPRPTERARESRAETRRSRSE